MKKKLIATGVAFVMGVLTGPLIPTSASAVDLVGGYTVPDGHINLTKGDLEFILDQIKISEAHAARTIVSSPSIQAPFGYNKDACMNAADIASVNALTGANAVSRPYTFNPNFPIGLRQVDGRCNNITTPANAGWGAGDEIFPRLIPRAPLSPTSYPVSALPNSVVTDSSPRVISNLIVDQTATNKAAVVAGVAVAGRPNPDTEVSINATTQSRTTVVKIGNTAPGGGAPYNGWFTLFGQFFDHGLDLVPKGNNGKVTVPLKPSDPLYVQGGRTNFMQLTRATNTAGESINLTTPYTDQNQTYTSHPSHQVLLREYKFVTVNNRRIPVATGSLLDGTDNPNAINADGTWVSNHANPTWRDVKDQTKRLLGITLTDADVSSVPTIMTDQYGNFIPGPNGYALLVLANGTQVVEGNPSANIGPSIGTHKGNIRPTGHAFLDDIAHNAVPTFANLELAPDTDTVANSVISRLTPAGSYDNELLDAHYITGDGRGNENIGLTAVHHVFHAEHNTLVTDIKGLLGNLQDSDRDFVSQWWDGTNFNGNRLFLAARLINESAYQHLVFDEFARRIQPALAPFGAYNPNENSAISAEFAHAVYRFGHSMLTETIGRSSSVGVSTPANKNDLGLIQGFLNPLMFRSTSTDFTNPGALISADQAAGNLAQGSVTLRDNEIDEFVTESLRNNLLGLPLDLSTLNIARARDTGVSTLNGVRTYLFSRTGQVNLVPYKNWREFQLALRTPASLVNFVAAYGTHPSIPKAQTISNISATADGTKITYVSPVTLPVNSFSIGQYVEANFGPSNPLNIVGQISSRVDTPTSTTFTVASTVAATTDPQTGSVEYSPSTAEIRNAADKIVNPQVGSPADSNQFLTGQPAPAGCLNADGSACGNWALTPTGLNSVDLWMGGLAEAPAVQPGLAGMLGSTFDYVFTEQMRLLQDGDRFYYLARLAGTNLLGEVENQGFASIIQRNSTARGLTNTVFSMPDCTIDIAVTLGRFNPQTGAIDPNFAQAACPELTQMPDGTIRFDGLLQNIVMVGTSGNDKLRGGQADDTIWGGAGNDDLNGGIGSDNISGEAGNDVIIDSAGDDVIRGGTGDDIINGGPGLDIIQGGIGNDFIFGGDATGTKTAEGQDGNDFIAGSAGADGAAGGSGSDWVEGNAGDDIIGGDNGVTEDLVALPGGGDDILIGGAGNDRLEGDSGNDIMVGGNGFDGFTGGPGYDWVIYNGAVDPVLVDLENIAAGVVPLDDFLEVEGVSGSAGNDFIFGDSLNTSQPTTIANITNFNSILNGVQGANGILSRSTGNLLLGGAGDDTFVPRGGNDLIHGDAYIRVCFLVSGVVGNVACGSGMGFESINEVSALMTTRQKTPRDISIVRELLIGAKGTDTVVLPGRRGDYNISSTTINNGNFRGNVSIPANDVVTVTGGGQTITLIGVENIRFLGTNLLPVLPATTFTFVQGDNITITQAALQNLAIDVTALQSGVYGDTSYFVTLDAFGGVGAYSWRVSAGALPAGLTLNPSTGVISGTLSAVTGTNPIPLVRLEVRDSSQTTQSIELPLVVQRKPLTVIVANQRAVIGVASTPSYTPVGLMGTDSIASVSYTYTGVGSTNYPASSIPPTAAGTYSVAPNAILLGGGVSILNYEVTRTPGQLVIGDAILSNRITPTINWPTPAVVAAGTFLSETQLNATISGGVPGELTYSPAAGTRVNVNTVVRVTFVPTDTTTYNMAASSVVVTVGTPPVTPVTPVTPPSGGGGSFFGGGIVQVKPVLEWVVPASITTDQKLDSTILKAKVASPSGIAGTFKYDVAEGTTLPVGTKKITATFTPADTLMFETVTISVDLKVVQAVIAAEMIVTNLTTVYDGGAKPVVVQTTPAGLTYTVTYNGSTVAPVNAGTYEVVATMADPAYSGKITRTLVIEKATPRITWATSGMMSSTSTVPGSVLNAQSNIPGTFAYSVQPGAALPVGTQEVVATFTPTDSTNYATTTARMNMEVVQGVKDMAMAFTSNNSKLPASTLRTLENVMKIPSSVIVVKSYVSPTKNKAADMKLSMTRGNLVRAQILARSPGAKVSVQALGSTRNPLCVAQANRCVVLSVNN